MRSAGPLDRMTRVGAAVFAAGALATLLTVTPLLLGTDRLPSAFYWLAMLMPLGLAVALTGLLVEARARGRRTRGHRSA